MKMRGFQTYAAILNVLSAAAWTSVDGNTAYSAAKSVECGLTNGVRLKLASQGTLVAALVPGVTATETMTDYAERAGIVFPEGTMNDPADLVRLTLDGLEAGDVEILDRFGVAAKATLSGPPRAFDLEAAAAERRSCQEPALRSVQFGAHLRGSRCGAVVRRWTHDRNARREERGRRVRPSHPLRGARRDRGTG
jgi:NAD(P)-dependent dehydrogenase (short-subunit alcohol dehydrogenase family)